MCPLEDTLPGYKEALRLGYTLATYSADRSYAVYCSRDMTLVVRRGVSGCRETAELCAFPIGALKLTTGDFTFPNKNFPEFERQVREILNR